MIHRYWRGLVKEERANDYVEHLRSSTIPELRKLSGFFGVSVTRRSLSHGVEFIVVSKWKSLESIEQFTGADVEAAVVPDVAQKMMIECDARVRHYESVDDVVADPPDGLPAYRLLTGPDDAAFCHRVSEALEIGYTLYGDPAATFNGENVIVAQALIWPMVRQAHHSRP